MSSAKPASRWWYAVAVTVVLGVVAYGFVGVVELLGPEPRPRSDASLVALVLSVFGIFVTGLLVYALTAVFVVGFVVDWKRVRDADLEWDPSPAYLLVPAATLANVAYPVYSLPVTVLGGSYYLYRRASVVGRPSLDWLP